jgi:hypothetical protein
MQEKRDYLLKDIISLRKELIELEDEKRRRRLALPSSYYYDKYGENPVANVFFSYSDPTQQALPLPYWSSGLPDLSSQYGNEQEEIHVVDNGDIAD